MLSVIIRSLLDCDDVLAQSSLLLYASAGNGDGVTTLTPKLIRRAIFVLRQS